MHIEEENKTLEIKQKELAIDWNPCAHVLRYSKKSQIK